MPPPVLSLRDIRLTFGGTPLLERADLAVAPGERVCLVGRNGSGKSTLLKVAAGLVVADGGERFVQPGASLRYLAQEPDLAGFATTLAYVEAGLGPEGGRHRAEAMLERLGLTGAEDPARLSGGEARRCALAAVLAPEPAILLLDEPTNHLDLPTIEWLEAELLASRSALVMVSHDRRFLETLSRATVWLSLGATRRLDRGFAHFEEWQDTILEQEEVESRKLDRRIASETQWLRRGVTARRRRNEGRRRALLALRQQRREQRRAAGSVVLEASEGEVSGKQVIEARHVSKSYGDTPVVRDLSLKVQRGDRVGIVGPNGAGKTTLLKLLTGAMPPDAGHVRLGMGLETAAMDQGRESLERDSSLVTVLTGGSGDTVLAGGQRKHVVSYLKDFLFTAEQAQTPVSALSGGERARLMLARVLAQPSNLLVLDEPTNDLDLETLDLLQEMLGDYGGTILLVSHDRDFLDRVVTSTIAAEGDGRWLEYAGGYSDMLAQRARAPQAAPPREANTSRTSKARPKPPRESAPATRARLTFKDKHALEALPKRMEALHTTVARLQAALADPTLYARDAAAFERTAAELRAAQADLAAAEDEWLALELKREAIEGA